MKLSVIALLSALPAYSAQQTVDVEVLDATGMPQKAILTLESDPVAVRSIWKVVTFGIPSAIFRSQGQSFDDYMSRPRYVRALEIVKDGKRTPVNLSAEDSLQLLHYFQNPTPGNVWAVKISDGEYAVRQLDGLQVSLNAKNRIADIRARTVASNGTQTPEWKSLRNGDIAQIYRPEASVAYRTETKHLPRVEVEAFPKVFLRLDRQSVPMRMLSNSDSGVTVVTETGFAGLTAGKGATGYNIDPSTIRLTTKEKYGNGEVSPEGLTALRPFNSGTIASLPSLMAKSCSENLSRLVQ